MAKTNLPTKKSFNKDPNAEKIARLMSEPDFAELPDDYRAKRVGIPTTDLKTYLNDPDFLRWASDKMRDYYLAQLPAVMSTIYQQALEGKGRQQKMLLDFMKVTAPDREEQRSPNITIITNIPDPYKDKAEPEVIIDASPQAGDPNGTDSI